LAVDAKAKVMAAAVPGLPFGADENIRLSYACSMAPLEKGMLRLERWLKAL
jgi:aspartate aminotransferase